MPPSPDPDPPLWVDVPHIPDLSEYTVFERVPPFVSRDDDLDDEPEGSAGMKRVLGSEMTARKLFYYVEMRDGGVEKFPAEDLEKRRNGLRLIRRFDRNAPSALAFNPRTDDRIRRKALRIRVRRPQPPGPRDTDTPASPTPHATSGSPSPAVDEYEPTPASGDERSTEDEESESEPEGSAYEEEEDELKPTRRSSRLAVRNAPPTTGPQRPGPSPKKARMRTRGMAKGDLSDVSEESDEDMYAASEVSVASPPPRRGGKKGPAKPEVIPNLELGDIYTITKHTPTEQEIADDDPLRAHRDTCERCRQVAAHLLKKRGGRKKGKKRRGMYDEQSEDEADVKQPEELGGWLKCVRCPIVAHWACAGANQREAVVKAVRAKTGEKWTRLERGEAGAFMCAACVRGQGCTGCGESVPEKKAAPKTVEKEVVVLSEEGDVEMTVEEKVEVPAEDGPPRDLLFRCTRCKRPAHYEHLPNPPKSYALPSAPPLPLPLLAQEYQSTWECAECDRWRYPLEHILAWRPTTTPGAPPNPPNEINRGAANMKQDLKREYLVKFEGRSYARCEWVPHSWLVAACPVKVKNFLEGGRKVELLAGDGEAEGGAVVYEGLGDGEPPQAEPDAERVIPGSWKCVDRLLDVFFWKPPAKVKRRGGKGGKRKGVVESDVEEEEEEDHEEVGAREPIMRAGEMPDEADLETYEERKRRTKRKVLSVQEDAGDIAWCYIKWQDLGYEHSTWDTPYPREGPAFLGMEKAFGSFLVGREIRLLRVDRREEDVLDQRRRALAKPYELVEQPAFGVGEGELFRFQLQGVSWLWMQWFQHRSAILADEMGLGKTVQVITFLAMLFTKHKTFPFLVVVPNSTLTNWLREFARWAPQLHVVPYYGEVNARKVIREFELFPQGPPATANQTRGDTGLRAHVVVTTYEVITNANSAVERSPFKAPSRWEVMVVDESQRLKNDTSLIFKKLKEIPSAHRVLMTGTPLNNNIRELFNLMNFLDPVVWNDAPALEKKYAELDEESVKELHGALKPYFLRRIKEDELDLPPRNEVIVPITMTPIQKELYKSILSKNAQLIGTIIGTINTKAVAKKGQLTNILMELRKCLQHPYLVHGVEPTDLDTAELHRVFTDASSKLKLLRVMLPILKRRGHRVLLFSQFVIALDIIEDFLNGEGYKYLRLDGNTKSSERQKGLDQFNREGSEYFIYILSTRAGGVGINLTAADTVIVFDPDFNPHSDHQAIARAHRIGQTKPVLVFKLMVKGSAEEKIMEVGKKKLILDHLIVQKMDVDDPEAEDVRTILSFGAKALFEEDTANVQDVTYSEQDIENLVVKTENEGQALTNVKAAKTKGMTFDFAKVWEASKNRLEELSEDDGSGAAALDNFWADVAQRAAEEEAKKQANVKLGRGAKRAAAAAVRSYAIDADGTPKKIKSKKAPSEVGTDAAADSDYAMSADESVVESFSSDDASAADILDVFEPDPKPKKKRARFVPPQPPDMPGLPPQHPYLAGVSDEFGPVPMLYPVPAHPAIAIPAIPAIGAIHGSQAQNENRPLPKMQPRPLQNKSAATTVDLSRPDIPSLKRGHLEDSDDSDESDDDYRCPLCKEEHEPGDCPGMHTLEELEEMKRRLQNSNEPDDLRAAAFREIQNRMEKLRKRNSIPVDPKPKAEPPKKKRKSAEQPKPQPVPQPPANPSKVAQPVVKGTGQSMLDQLREISKPKPRPPTAAPPPTKTRPAASTVKVATSTRVPTPPPVGPSVAGPSRRTSGPSQKGFKADNCPVCNESYHPPKRCAILNEGPLTLKRQIKALSSQPHLDAYVMLLKDLLYVRHNIPYKENAAPGSDPPSLGAHAIASNGSPLPGSTCLICRKPNHYSSTCPSVGELSSLDVQKATMRLDKFFSRPDLGKRDKLDYEAALKLLSNRSAVLRKEERRASLAHGMGPL